MVLNTETHIMKENISIMTCQDVVNISDLEEGEINGASDLEEISDVSSEEEKLLRKRIEILENYNSALGKKRARLLSSGKGEIKTAQIDHRKHISSSRNNEIVVDKNKPVPSKRVKTKKLKKKKHLHHKKYPIKNIPLHRRRSHYKDNASSSESDHENKHQKKILREAIAIPTKKTDQSSLKKRLLHMIKGPQRELKDKSDSVKEVSQGKIIEISHTDNHIQRNSDINNVKVIECFKANVEDSVINLDSSDNADVTTENQVIPLEETDKQVEVDDLEEQKCIVVEDVPTSDVVDEGLKIKETVSTLPVASNCSSDEEAELLRQLALNSKAKRKNNNIAQQVNNEEYKLEPQVNESKADDSMDSDTAELRLIALKSAMLKKAMEMRQQIKENRKRRHLKRKRRSLTSIFSDDEIERYLSCQSNNDNTDIEAIDMEITADNEIANSCNIYDNNIYNDHLNYSPNVDPNAYQNSPQNLTENQPYQYLYNDYQYYDSNNFMLPMKHSETFSISVQDKDEKNKSEEDLEEDEDILRAKLLNSMSLNSKSIPREPPIEGEPDTKISARVEDSKPDEQSDSGLIIRLGESSGSECETTKNLTIMHQKLVKSTNFQRNLEEYLKSMRSNVENSTKHPTHLEQPPVFKKHTPIAVRHLPKADQQEYRRLVKRMSELEKVKLARQQIQQNSFDSRRNNFKVTITQGESSLLNKSLSDNDCGRIVESPAVQRVKVQEQVTANSLQVVNSQPSVMEIQLNLTRLKISSHVKIVEQLKTEGTELRQKMQSFTEQMNALAVAYRTSQIALNNNQRTFRTAQRNLVKLRKQYHILINKVKKSPLKNNNILITVQQNENKNLNITKTITNDILTKDVPPIVLPHKVEFTKNTSEKTVITNVNSSIKKHSATTLISTKTGVSSDIKNASELKVQNNDQSSTIVYGKDIASIQNLFSNDSCVVTAEKEIIDVKELPMIVKQEVNDTQITIGNHSKLLNCNLDVSNAISTDTKEEDSLLNISEKENKNPLIEEKKNAIFDLSASKEKEKDNPPFEENSSSLFDICIVKDETHLSKEIKLYEKNVDSEEVNKNKTDEQLITTDDIQQIQECIPLECDSESMSSQLNNDISNDVTSKILEIKDEFRLTNVENESILNEENDIQTVAIILQSNIECNDANLENSDDCNTTVENCPVRLKKTKDLSTKVLSLNEVGGDNSSGAGTEDVSVGAIDDKCLDVIKPTLLDCTAVISELVDSDIDPDHSTRDNKSAELDVNQEYESPLHILKMKTCLSDDSQAIFCPFEVGGSCKDPQCKYFHPKS